MCADCILNCILLCSTTLCGVQQLFTKRHGESNLELVIVTSARVLIKVTRTPSGKKKKKKKSAAERSSQAVVRGSSCFWRSFFPCYFVFVSSQFSSFCAHGAARVDSPISRDAENEEPKRTAGPYRLIADSAQVWQLPPQKPDAARLAGVALDAATEKLQGPRMFLRGHVPTYVERRSHAAVSFFGVKGAPLC